MFKLLFLLLISLPSFASDWTDADKKREAVYLALHFIDYKQTLALPNQGRPELNPILGRHPSRDRVDLWFASGAILHVLIADVLPAEYRKMFQYLTVGAEGSVVLRNHFIGVEARF